MIIDTYDLGNGYTAELLETQFTGQYSIRTIFYNGDDNFTGFTTWRKNPFDVIFVLMDLGLIKTDNKFGPDEWPKDFLKL